MIALWSYRPSARKQKLIPLSHDRCCQSLLQIYLLYVLPGLLDPTKEYVRGPKGQSGNA